MSDNQPFDPTATSVFGLAPVVDEVEEAPVALSARDREAVEGPGQGVGGEGVQAFGVRVGDALDFGEGGRVDTL